MDGRVQSSIIDYLQARFQVKFVDNITEPGPVRIFAKTTDMITLNSIINRVGVSIDLHKSCGIAICAHPDCAGNPIDNEAQKEQLEKSVLFLKEIYPNSEVIGIWVENNQQPHEHC
jgi:hypothetical protein